MIQADLVAGVPTESVASAKPKPEEPLTSPSSRYSIPLDPKTKSIPKCDLVMKGGLTSGVVYPKAVLVLAQKHQFVNIGGTSAGAIAAALSGAAEMGRKTGGFEKLEKVHEQLSAPNFLLNIFRARGEARPLMELFVDFLGINPVPKGKVGMIRAFLRLTSNRFTETGSTGLLYGAISLASFALVIAALPWIMRRLIFGAN
jgi:hypothetical protein